MRSSILPKSTWWVWASLLAMTLASCGSLFFRYKVEASNHAVGIVMEGQALHDLAASSGRDLYHLLVEYKTVGLSGVALTEDTIGDLVDRGTISLTPETGNGVVVTGSPSEVSRVASAIARR